jgi:CDGSH-type Zn-finger protein
VGRIVVSKNGPYLVSGSLPLRKEIAVAGDEGEPEKWRKGRKYPLRAHYFLCRCGRSRRKPFCDGAHVDAHFDGTETAGFKPFAAQAGRIRGPGVDLGDAEALCSSARFCLAKGGTWRLTLRSGDARKKKLAITQARNCPSGRLVAYDKRTGVPLEPGFEPSISLTEGPEVGAGGPVWVKGSVPIVSATGKVYEARNRVTLCRCGKSRNKPFCDGSHTGARFKAGVRTGRGIPGAHVDLKPKRVKGLEGEPHA